MAAALATLRVLEETGTIAHMARLGPHLGIGLEQLAADHGFQVTVSGPPALPYIGQHVRSQSKSPRPAC